ncbi:MAG: hypothetical protein ACRDLY_07700, partial [Thermoleophilaceae bacterium]
MTSRMMVLMALGARPDVLAHLFISQRHHRIDPRRPADVYFGPLRLGRFHERTHHLEDARLPVPAALLS